MAVKLLLVAAALVLSASALNDAPQKAEDEGLPSSSDVASLIKEANQAADAAEKRVPLVAQKKEQVIAAVAKKAPAEKASVKAQTTEKVVAAPVKKVVAQTEEQTVNAEAADALKDALNEEEGAEKAALKDEDTEAAPAKPSLRLAKGVDAPIALSGGSPDLVFGDKDSSSFETDVTNLMLGLGGAKFGATPLGSSVKMIAALINNEMIPKVLRAHKLNQQELDKLIGLFRKCGSTKKHQLKMALDGKRQYTKTSPRHKKCRSTEAQLFTELKGCVEELKDKKAIKNLKCKEFAMVEKKYSNQQANRQIVSKAGGESAESYVKRITATICGGKGKNICGFECKLMKAKKTCSAATKKYIKQTETCKRLERQYGSKKKQCNNLQDTMDQSACQYAIDTKDSCEQYAECHSSKAQAYRTSEKMVKKEEKDRKSEWRGLKRMGCLISAFMDTKVTADEIKKCKGKTYATTHLIIKYHKLPRQAGCEVPTRYPSTASYKKAEFASLPIMAKGKQDANECTGVQEVNIKPKKGSPKTCKCDRVTMNGPYTAGPVVKCVNCLDVRRTNDKNSCPDGTKIFAPQTRADWSSFLKSTRPLRAPHWIIDVTRPQNGCGGCTGHPMNSGVKAQKTWRTGDGSPWWLRSTRYNEPNGDYHANCYLDLWHTPRDSKSVTFNDGSCGYHSKSYYCQPKQISLKPKSGSPNGCVCKKVELAGEYTAGALLRCDSCIDVRRTTQKNSCPVGTKVFAPASRNDWKTFIRSASPLRSPHWIIDITRPQNGCGGCTRHAMNSKSAAQKTWRTSDGAAWWLRSSRYSEPNGDYSANCYLDLWHAPANENLVTWNDGRCNYHSRSYYCQQSRKKR